MREFYYQGILRLDWGLGNPNKTAALICMTMIAIWSVAWLFRRGFWPALVVFTLLGVCLVQTFSRGGVVALVAGAIPLMIFAPRPWLCSRTAGVFLSLMILCAQAAHLRAIERYSQGIGSPDQSIQSRIAVWKDTPKMMVDSPEGWGFGNSATAYNQWYKSDTVTVEFRSLMNSHLVWMVEVNWPLRFAYCMFWIAAVILCWPKKEYPWLSIPLGVITAFFVSAVFTHVGESPWIRFFALGTIGAVLCWRMLSRNWPAPTAFRSAAVGAFIICCLLYFSGRSGTGIRGNQDQITIGYGPSKSWLVPDQSVFGKSYGRRLTETLAPIQDTSSLTVTRSFDLVSHSNIETLITGGEWTPAQLKLLAGCIQASRRTILIGPKFFPEDLSLPTKDLSKIQVIFGEFSRPASLKSWERNCSVKREPGVGDFIPDWPEIVRTVLQTGS